MKSDPLNETTAGSLQLSNKPRERHVPAASQEPPRLASPAWRGNYAIAGAYRRWDRKQLLVRSEPFCYVC